MLISILFHREIARLAGAIFDFGVIRGSAIGDVEQEGGLMSVGLS